MTSSIKQRKQPWRRALETFAVHWHVSKITRGCNKYSRVRSRSSNSLLHCRVADLSYNARLWFSFVQAATGTCSTGCLEA